MNVIQTAIQYISDHPVRFIDALHTHLLLSAAALVGAFMIAFPLGVLLAGSPKASGWATSLFTSLRVIPSLAVLALMIPMSGTGFNPALIALLLLAIPPILVNTIQGLSQVDKGIREAALGMGMTDMGLLHRINLPLAWPAILSGIRTATIEVLASATLAALIGGGGLGGFIINGLGMYNFGLLLVGALPVVFMVLIAEGGFGLLERLTTRYRTC